MNDMMGKNNGKMAVILINMGGPADLLGIRPFLYNLFNDDHIISLPQPLRAMLARIISITRTPGVKKHYALIGGGSPLKNWTDKQAGKVKAILSGRYPNIAVKTAYSYVAPLISDTIAELAASGHNNIIACPLYPQYSVATLGSIYADLEKERNKSLKITRPFYEHPQYISAIVQTLRTAISEIDLSGKYHVIFSAHALPQSYIDKGDPYRQQIERTIALVLNEYPLDNYSLSFQSKIGPVAWMKPSTIETVRQIGQSGVRQVIVMPIGFVCDHIETLYELDIELASIAKESGITKFVRGETFNDSDAFAQLLVSLIEEKIS
jgi:protoporphyrin/coproporphyrin ferrochelatase